LYDLIVLLHPCRTLPLIFVVATACSSSVDDSRASMNLPTVTHAVVELQRSRSTNAAIGDQANALVSVLRLPATLNSRNIVRMVGLSPTHPEPGQCERVDYARSATEVTSSVRQVEMLDVGDVTLMAGNRASPLARQAFPTVTDFIAGVVYTTRDLSSDRLPLSDSYTIIARGTPTVPPFRIEAAAPQEPSNITVDGLNIAQVSRLARGVGVDLTWTPGQPGDRFLVEVKSPDKPNDVTCAYDDAAGRGRLAPDVLLPHGTVRFEIHRLRSTFLSIKGLDHTQVEFDYSVDHLFELVD
jgi:hypothetical protein